MSFKYTHLMHMSYNELHNHLMQRKLPALVREEIQTTVREQQAALKSDNAQRKAVGNQWKPLIKELNREREIVRGSITYATKQQDDARVLAFEGYRMVLDRLKDEFDGYRRQRETPAKLAASKGIPNGGIHWVDWVKPKFIDRVMALFAEIPHKRYAKQKEPFVRYIRTGLHEEQKARLRQRTEKELGVAMLDLELDPTDKRQAKVDLLREAMRRIDRMLPTDPVPRTYSGLFTDKESS